MRKVHFFAALAFLVATNAYSEEKKSASSLQRLKDTASGFHALAEKKMILAASEKDEEKKKSLLEASRLLEESAELTEKKIVEEEILERDPAVKKARTLKQKSKTALEETEKNFNALVLEIQKGEGSKKESAERGTAFLNLKKEKERLANEYQKSSADLSAIEKKLLENKLGAKK